MTTLARSRKRNILFDVIVGLFVTVLGGLTVEVLKPVGELLTPTDVRGSEKHSSQPQNTPTVEKYRQALIGKWYIPPYQRPNWHGDLDVEFMDLGQVVRNYYRFGIPDAVTKHPYEVLEGGRLKSDVNLDLVSVSANELILSWNGTIVYYKRGMSWWRDALIPPVFLVLVILFVVWLRRGRKN